MGKETRITALQKKLEEHHLNGALLHYSRDIFYYTGTAQPAYLAVLPDDYALFIRSGLTFALSDVFIDHGRVREERRPENIYREFFSAQGKPLRIGTELDVLTVEQFRGLEKAFADCSFINISPLILAERRKKEPSEIEKIRDACRTIHAGHEAALAVLREGVTELELAAAVENGHRLAGHEGIFFIRLPDFYMSRGPIASGPNLSRISGVVYTITGVGLSPSVPAGPSRRRIARGEPVIIDIPVLTCGYHADQTRTYCIGEASPAIRAMHRDLVAIADHLIEKMRPGMPCNEIFRMALDKAEALGRSEHFQSFGPGRKSRMIGHGIGLELNEPPIVSEYDRSLLDEDCVVALDMHLMDARADVVKLEDMILIRRGGNEILTGTPRELFETS